MSMIQVKNLSFSYPASIESLFDDLSFEIDTEWKIGVVGRNGRGKTTLMKLLMGEYVYNGKITCSVKFDYFPYLVPDKNRSTAEVMNGICPEAEEWEVVRELKGLDVSAEVLERNFEILSGGEQTKIFLAGLFLKKENFLLLDEPTNHLDAAARRKVSEYLKKKKGFLLISHDRQFLDGCVDHILAFTRTGIEIQNGDFSSWMTNFQKRQESEISYNERLKKEIRRLEISANRSAVWSGKTENAKKVAKDKGYVGHKSAKMMKRAKNIEQRKSQAVQQKTDLLKDMETAEPLKIFPLNHQGSLLAAFADTAVVYGGRRICEPLSFSIRSGERIFLDGKNGSGKSSLLKLLIGDSIAYEGTVNIASGLVVSYVPQSTAHLTGTLEEFFGGGLDESLFKAILRKMGFERAQFKKNLKDYSEGQKKKVLIAKSLCEQAHLYIWDEPLNYIDLYSRIQIEQLIERFSPTMLVVEHDAAFRERLATRVITL